MQSRKNDLLILDLIYYIQERKKGPVYKSFWGQFFGFPRDVKVSAAQALCDYVITPNAKNLEALIPYLDALDDGDLKKQWNLFKNNNPDDYQAIEDEVKRLKESKEKEHRHVDYDSYSDTDSDASQSMLRSHSRS